jgi:NAD(P)-dependent dehydrogenase (short-subunit alcohol dehydrogenase family)
VIAEDVQGDSINVTSQTGDRQRGGRGLYAVLNTTINGLNWSMTHDYAGHGIRVKAMPTDAAENPSALFRGGATG